MNNDDSIPECIKKETTETEGVIKIIINKNSIYDDYLLYNFRLSTGEVIAALSWMGASLKTGVRIFQPALITNRTDYKVSLSYDGVANYIRCSDTIVMPSDGSTYIMSPPTQNYFNNNNPLVPNPDYELSDNNKSIYLQNISIFKEDRSQGIIINLRASMQGSVLEPPNSGIVIVNFTVDTIN